MIKSQFLLRTDLAKGDRMLWMYFNVVTFSSPTWKHKEIFSDLDENLGGLLEKNICKCGVVLKTSPPQSF